MVEMTPYRMRNRCEAVRIDKDWLKFLLVDRNKDEAKLGYYYVVNENGDEWVLDPVKFNRLFEPCDA